jgi:hypothetical protein
MKSNIKNPSIPDGQLYVISVQNTWYSPEKIRVPFLWQCLNKPLGFDWFMNQKFLKDCWADLHLHLIYRSISFTPVSFVNDRLQIRMSVHKRKIMIFHWLPFLHFQVALNFLRSFHVINIAHWKGSYLLVYLKIFFLFSIRFLLYSVDTYVNRCSRYLHTNIWVFNTSRFALSRSC